MTIPAAETASGGKQKSRRSRAGEAVSALSAGPVEALLAGGGAPRLGRREGSDQLYRVLVERMHEGAVTLDGAGHILYANRRFARMMQAPRDALLAAPFARFVNAVSAHEFAALIKDAPETHSSAELLLRDAKGSAVPAFFSATRIRQARMPFTCLVIRDLRQRDRQQALAKDEQLARSILEQASEAIVVLDPQGVIVRCSKSAKLLAGQGVLLAHFDRAFPLSRGATRCTAAQILCAMREGRTVRSLEAAMMSPGGEILSLLVSGSALWDECGALLGCVVTLIDITARKRAEEALARQAEELARSNSDLRQFAYSASHDLREPVRQIGVFGELLQKKYGDALDSEGAYLIRHVVASADRADKLLKDLLSYVQTAETPLAPAVLVDSNEVARRCLAGFETQLREARGRIDCDPLPLLKVHEVHLVQLLQNLVSNALKYRGEGPPRIRIRAAVAGSTCTLSVEDNGIGVRKEHQRQIFELFRRLHSGEKYTGSGVGLAICQKIVRRYGGRIWVESEPGKGSKFVLTLPAAHGVNGAS